MNGSRSGSVDVIVKEFGAKESNVSPLTGGTLQCERPLRRKTDASLMKSG
jgi:hypothetical protein